MYAYLDTHPRDNTFFEEHEGIGQDQSFFIFLFLHCLNGHLLFSKKPSDVIKYGFEKSENQTIEFLYRKSFQILYKNKSFGFK